MGPSLLPEHPPGFVTLPTGNQTLVVELLDHIQRLVDLRVGVGARHEQLVQGFPEHWRLASRWVLVMRPFS